MASEDDSDVEEILGDLDDEEKAEQETEEEEEKERTRTKTFKTSDTTSSLSDEPLPPPVVKVRRNQKGGYQAVPTVDEVAKDKQETISTNTTSATFGNRGATRNLKSKTTGGGGSGNVDTIAVGAGAGITKQKFASQKTKINTSVKQSNDASTGKTITTNTNTRDTASTTTTVTSQDTFSNSLDMLNPKKSGSIAVLFDFEMLKTLYAMAIFIAGAVELFTATFSIQSDDVLVWACLWLVLLAGHVLFLFILIIIIGIHGSGPHRAAVIMYAINLSMQIIIMTLVVAVAFDMYYHTNAAQTDNRLAPLGLAPVAANNFNLIKWYAILVLFLLITVVDFGATAFIVLHDRMCCQ